MISPCCRLLLLLPGLCCRREVSCCWHGGHSCPALRRPAPARPAAPSICLLMIPLPRTLGCDSQRTLPTLSLSVLFPSPLAGPAPAAWCRPQPQQSILDNCRVQGPATPHPAYLAPTTYLANLITSGLKFLRRYTSIFTIFGEDTHYSASSLLKVSTSLLPN